MSIERDTYKYNLWWHGEIVYSSITYDLARIEALQQRLYPGCRMEQVGGKSTRASAAAWAIREEAKRAK